MTDTLRRLADIVARRAGAAPQESHTAALLAKGRAKVAEKLGEEAVETVIAAVQGDRAALISESADLLFHLSVLWHDAGIGPEDVDAELARREGRSGLEEKAAR
ncbi:phosphoribosyl-ATP diphosphatase [Pacificimonas flava]|uniref:Phosphoribosyl-ATP pyrophosphatase n=1 Tax=Pacificimonas flava TaxID=1234595 RepID=M2U241_9SPHN|nr:phosphoribosyl-ATP diphosphatase [Pacificimonas flava]EMD81858.1 Phosphoribosyl-ATP pyrophosphatase [Pacificimonas flava]MBB5281612.1 phosphoribosyl-ATP pyrophosphohydrolase [Pacificimonas flava]